MAPLRRYVRITEYSVLECRIFLENPALGESWLVNPRTAILSRVMKSVYPLIAPRLREEYERSKNKSFPKKSNRDSIIEDDFEVSMFFIDTRTRHSLLKKQKIFYENNKEGIRSNSNKLCGTSAELPIDVPPDEPNTRDSMSSPNAELNLRDLPDAGSHPPQNTLDEPEQCTMKRSRDVSSPHSSAAEPPSKRLRNQDLSASEEEHEEKKLSMRTTYDGFTVYGRVLCLVVKRRDRVVNQTSGLLNQATMENWISSTQPTF
ncbi:hypothetical protein GcC1_085028 [Golovinomyces cichoracearum]|uniref:Uncharacterized protein n=1 Tax=Golovinomyces cichoracearum TaxID=62708 RepID=A0A420II78_9PEZI|nr:hypothetical protein GcC1_085028 [Golovinomyces cichoracearum]